LQHLGAYVNLAAYYVLRIPIVSILGFWAELRGKGLWIGIVRQHKFFMHNNLFNLSIFVFKVQAKL